MSCFAFLGLSASPLYRALSSLKRGITKNLATITSSSIFSKLFSPFSKISPLSSIGSSLKEKSTRPDIEDVGTSHQETSPFLDQLQLGQVIVIPSSVRLDKSYDVCSNAYFLPDKNHDEESEPQTKLSDTSELPSRPSPGLLNALASSVVQEPQVFQSFSVDYSNDVFGSYDPSEETYYYLLPFRDEKSQLRAKLLADIEPPRFRPSDSPNPLERPLIISTLKEHVDRYLEMHPLDRPVTPEEFIPFPQFYQLLKKKYCSPVIVRGRFE